jgi:predicted dehydrogenase
MLDVLGKYTGVHTYDSFDKLLREESPDCVFVSTPSRYHADIVGTALDRGLHVFCEKPFALEPETGYRLADVAERKRLVNQVGYHYRFIASFNEAKRLLDLEVLGRLHHVRIEAYGPVVLRQKGLTWRSHKSEGGGCLFDYACHAIDLANYILGRPIAVSGTILDSVFSNDVDDEIYSTLQFEQGLHGQLATNWSDESIRKMSMRMNLWGTNGRMNIDRQELQIYLRSVPHGIDSLKSGWNSRYTTDLTPPVWFYMRGEEYSAQIDHFIRCVSTGATPVSTFRTASDTMLVAAMMIRDAARGRTAVERQVPAAGPLPPPPARRSLVAGLFHR